MKLTPFSVLWRSTAAAVMLSLGGAASASDAPPHNISAANLNVVENDAQNTEASVTVTATLSINDMRVRPGSNRGDYNVQVGDSGADDLAAGMPLVAVSQNDRYNLVEGSEPQYGAPAFDGTANGYWCVLQDVTSDRAEYNVNCAVAYFRYTNWLCGWARNKTASNGGTNNLFTSSPGIFLGNQFRGIKSGESRVDLTGFGFNSQSDGVLLVNHAKNEGNFCLAHANSDGTWEVYVKDNFGTTANPLALEQDPCAFVFIPKTNTTVVSGKFGLDNTGTNAAVIIRGGPANSWSITNTDVGKYRLTIPGYNPSSGVLIVSAEGGFTNNFDDIVTYEADGDGWVIEQRDTGVYPPPLEACTNEPVASFVFIPAASPGFTITPTNALVTAEFGLAATFTVQLDVAPTNDVTIGVSSSNPVEGVVSTSSLTFTTNDWNIPQVVTVTGQDDALADGNVPYTIVLSPAVSTDPAYSGRKPADVAVVNIDDEQTGITVTPTNGLVTSESGDSATFAVFLNRAPTDNVTIGISSSDTNEGAVDVSSLTFTPTNWNTPQMVTVTGVRDFVQDGNKAYSILTAPAVSGDLAYSGVKPADVAAINIDVDKAGYVWNYSIPINVVEGSTTNYTVHLASRPSANVVFQVASSATSVGTVSPATLTFTPENWNVPQAVTVTGVDNFVTNPPAAFNITNAPSSTDPVYSQLTSAIILPAVVIDNETSFLLPSGDCYFGLGMPAIGIDGMASVQDVDAVTYEGGSVRVTIATNAQAADALAIRSDGTNAGQIGVSGTNVTYEGGVVGGYEGGQGATPLIVTLNSNSTVAAVQQLIRSVTFFTPNAQPSLVTRQATVEVNDGLGVTVSAAKNIHVGAMRLTQYQEGGDYGYGVYAGAEDIALSQADAFKSWPAGRTPAPTEGLLIDWPDSGTPNESQVLLRFDDFVGTNYWQVPSNAIIVSAELWIQVNNPGDGGTLHRMLIDWDSTNATWASVGYGIAQDDVQSKSMYYSQLGVEDGSGATGNGIVSIGVTPDVQAWVDGETNFGWVFKGWPLQTDGTGFTPSEYSDVGARPRLHVLWLQPQYAAASFRQGVDGYTNVVDTNIRQNTPDENYATEDTLWSDANDAGNTNTTEFLIRFDSIIGYGTNQIPPGSTVHAAMLDLASVANNSMGDGGLFYAMLQPWQDTTTTWNSVGGGIRPDGVIAAATPTAVAGNATLDPDVQGTDNSYDVTVDVQAWVNGTRPNYGWGVVPWPGGSNGWGSRSSEFVSYADLDDPTRDCPRLRVFFTAPSSVGPATLQAPVVSAGAVQVRFTGQIGATYTVLRAGSVTGSWSSIGTATVGADGTAALTDPTPLAGGAFYQVVYLVQ